jgi:hypothetical protein
MSDLLAILAAVFLFAVAIAYTAGCEHLQRSRHHG